MPTLFPLIVFFVIYGGKYFLFYFFFFGRVVVVVARYHMGKNGKPAVCRASVKACPVGGDEVHAGSKAELMDKISANSMGGALKSTGKNDKKPNVRMTPIRKAHKLFKRSKIPGNVLLNGRELSVARAQVLNDFHNQMAEITRLRGAAGLVSDDKTRTNAAMRRLNKLSEYFMSRDNSEGIKKLKGAVLASARSFNVGGRKITVNDALRLHANKQAWADANKSTKEELTRLAQDSSVAAGTYQFDGVKVTVTDGHLNNTVLKTLDEDTIRAISKPYSTIDINLAKQKLTPEQLDSVLTYSQVSEVFDSRPEMSRTLPTFDAAGSAKGESAVEKFNSLGVSYGNHVHRMQYLNGGGKTTIDNDLKVITSVVKEDSAKVNEKRYSETGKRSNMVYAGRRMDSGVLVSARNSIDRKLAEQNFDEATIRSISVQTPRVDPKLAAKYLSPEQYKKLFSSRKVSMLEERYNGKKLQAKFGAVNPD